MRRFALFSLLLYPGISPAQGNLFDYYHETVQSPVQSWVLDVENDAFRDSDRYYTNGIRYSRYYSGKDKITFNGQIAMTVDDDGNLTTVDGVQGPTRTENRSSDCQRQNNSAYEFYYLAHNTDCYIDGDKVDLYKHYAGWLVANVMYTPKDITAKFEEFEQYDRPYAGYTYFGRFVETVHADDSLTRYEIQGGLLGKASATQAIQRAWHDIFGFDRPEWEKQIESELALQVNILHRFAVPSFLKWELNKRTNTRLFDVQPYVFGEAGTVFVRASVGIDVRVGLMQGLISGPRGASPIGSIQKILSVPGAKSAYDNSQCVLKYFCVPESGYLFGKIEETGVLRNSTIQGGMFTDSEYTQDFRSRVRTMALGLKIYWTNWGISFSWKNRSPEVAGVPFDSGYHRWAELQVTRSL